MSADVLLYDMIYVSIAIMFRVFLNESIVQFKI